MLNIGNAAPEPLMDFIKALEDATGIEAEKNMMEMQAGDVVATWANADLLEKIIGYRPDTPMREGVEKFVAWYRDYYQV